MIVDDCSQKTSKKKAKSSEAVFARMPKETEQRTRSRRCIQHIAFQSRRENLEARLVASPESAREGEDVVRNVHVEGGGPRNQGTTRIGLHHRTAGSPAARVRRGCPW